MDCTRCGGPVSVQGTVCDECQDRPVRRVSTPAFPQAKKERARAAKDRAKARDEYSDDDLDSRWG